MLSARNLGAYFDSNMTLVPFINNTYKSAFSQLYNIRRIRKYLSADSSKTLVLAVITSGIDYCNSLLWGLLNNSKKQTSAGSKRSGQAYDWNIKVFAHNSSVA